MWEMTRLAMGVALAVALSLALVFTLLILLLADLFCTLRHRRLQKASPDSCEGPPTPPHYPPRLPFYAHGVLRAPTSLLLTIPKLEAAVAAAAVEPPPPPPPPPQKVKCRPAAEAKGNLQCFSLASLPSSPCPHRVSSASVSSADRFLCISNPIFDEACVVGGGTGDGDGTPFETPETSPSHFGYEDDDGAESDRSPPLTLMKKLPTVLPKACSEVCLTDGRRSLATSVSATETSRPCFSSSSSPCTSPSW